MDSQLVDKLAAGMNEKSKELFLGLVETIESKSQELSERAKKANSVPSVELPIEVLEAILVYTRSKRKSMH